MNLLPYMPVIPLYDVNIRIRQPRKASIRIDPINFYSDEEFRKRYRFTKGTFRYICDEFEDDLGRATHRQYALSTAAQLCIALHFYASGSFLEVVGDTHMSVSKSTVSRVVYDVSLALSRKLDRYVSFPTDQEQQRQIAKGFYDIGKFPGIVGAVDGTHIRILSPGGDQEPYYVNRKHTHSINVQGICDHEGRFLNIVADWPSSVHDARIISCSKVGSEFATGQRRGILLGDSGYACTTWLLTPFLAPIGSAQKTYNVAHRKTRCVIERTFGMWKRRFHVLHSEIRMSPIRVCRIIGACAVLHNVAKARHDDADFEEEGDNNDNDDSQVVPSSRNAGNTFRAHFAQRHFSQTSE